MADLIMYYGEECTHCHAMDPLIEKLEKEKKVKVKRVETWHNAKNKEQFMKDNNGQCPGVPFFINKKNGKTICGEASYEEVVDWAS